MKINSLIALFILILSFSCGTQNNANREYADIKYKNKRDKVKDENVEVLIKGNLNLYMKSNNLASVNASTGVMTNNQTTTYYIKKKGEPYAVFYLGKGYSPPKSFKNVIEENFKDCPDIIEKFENKTFKKKHFIEIVEYYNANCGK